MTINRIIAGHIIPSPTGNNLTAKVPIAVISNAIPIILVDDLNR